MKFIDRFFYLIFLMFMVFLLFIVSFWNIFIVPINNEIHSDISRFMAQEERTLYAFFETSKAEDGKDQKTILKKQKICKLRKTYKSLLYDNDILWLQNNSFCRQEHDFTEKTEIKFLKTIYIWFMLFVSFLALQFANKINLKRHYGKMIPLIGSAALLFYADSSLPGDTAYQLIKTAVFITSLYFTYDLKERFYKRPFFWFFLASAFVFNPFFTVLHKIPESINLYAAVFFAIYFVYLCLQKKYRK